jgi:citrate lyase subunit beta/citryl-CoA lyase
MRSYLYVPGNRPSMVATALSRGADAVIVDLEDAVPPGGKVAARLAVADWLRALPMGSTVYVRINPGKEGLEDAQAVVGPALHGLVVAKANTVDELGEIAPT